MLVPDDILVVLCEFAGSSVLGQGHSLCHESAVTGKVRRLAKGRPETAGKCVFGCCRCASTVA